MEPMRPGFSVSMRPGFSVSSTRGAVRKERRLNKVNEEASQQKRAAGEALAAVRRCSIMVCRFAHLTGATLSESPIYRREAAVHRRRSLSTPPISKIRMADFCIPKKLCNNEI